MTARPNMHDKSNRCTYKSGDIANQSVVCVNNGSIYLDQFFPQVPFGSLSGASSLKWLNAKKIRTEGQAVTHRSYL